MENLWPWLALAGVGALHGLNPATGWALAAAWGLRPGEGARPSKALLPMAAGHMVSVALVAGAVAGGLQLDRFTLVVLAGALFALAVVIHVRGHVHKLRAPAGHTGMALWSFMVSTAQGAGLMLVPALMPLCAGGLPASGPGGAGPLTLALAALAVHAASMLAVTGLVATGVCRGVAAGARFLPARERALR